jgi:peroxiredoxin Q/BCP
MGLFSSSNLEPGDAAPDFTLNDQSGTPVTLSKLRGRRIVLYFYPKADTPGCTKEACSFREAAPRYPSDVTVLGVSKDSVDSQKAFSGKFSLNFPLLADSDGKVIESYGVDSLFGFAKRKTFLIDSKGKIAKVYESVDPTLHADEVLEALSGIE